MVNAIQASSSQLAGRRPSFLAFAAVATLLFGIKLWLISVYGNATPLWDQWDAEAAYLYQPYLEGTLGWRNLLAPHNEHRIFTHRILALALFELNGTWNPLLQMVVGALVHIFTIGLGVALLARVVGRQHLPALLVFSLVLFGVPCGWENTLGGFHSAFYLVFPFSFAGMWLLTTNEPLTARWWGGVICALLAFLSLASGLLVPAVAAIMGLAMVVSGRRRTRNQWIAVAILCALFVLEAMLTPRLSLSKHTIFKASSFPQFFDALTATLSWPFASSLFSALVLNLPALIFACIVLWKRPAADDRKWFLLTLVVWVFGQAASISYGRAVGTLASRYLDSFALGILVNFACVISIAQEHVSNRRGWTICAASAWIVAAMISLALYGREYIPVELGRQHAAQLSHEINTRNFLATGDFDCLEGKSFFEVPHSSPERLAELLASPTVRAIVPSNIRPPLAATSILSDPVDAFVTDGFYPVTPKRDGWTLGSYSSQGDAATGRAVIRFDANQHDVGLSIPVAGYPLNKDISLEIEQDGRRKPLVMKFNSGESWQLVSTSIEKGPYSILITDMNGGSTGWVAVGTPVPQGRFDAFTNRVLANYLVFIMLGLAGGVLAVMQYPRLRVDVAAERQKS